MMSAGGVAGCRFPLSPGRGRIVRRAWRIPPANRAENSKIHPPNSRESSNAKEDPVCRRRVEQLEVVQPVSGGFERTEVDQGRSAA